MATAQSQRRWRRKSHLVKRQLNVMARGLVHGYLEEIATAQDLRGKGEAVAFSAYVVRVLMQQAEYDPVIAERLATLRESYHRDRELYQS